MKSFRFKLPALFLAGIVLASLISALIALRLIQGATETQATTTLLRQADGLATLYSQGAIEAANSNLRAPKFAASTLEKATGTKIYYVGVPLFPGQISGLRQLGRNYVDFAAIKQGHSQVTRFEPPGEKTVYIAAAVPLKLGGQVFGGLVVAKPRSDLRQQLLVLLERVAIGLLAGVAAAFGLFSYLSRRLTKPLTTLATAADSVAAGDYNVPIPRLSSDDEIGHLSNRFADMVSLLSETNELARSFLMKVSHELRTPLTSITGHAEALLEGLADDDKAMRDSSLMVIRDESARLGRLVGDLLDLAKLQARRFVLHEEEVPLATLLDRVYTSFSPEALRRGIEFERSIAANPVITTDGDRLLQVVTNLLGNAFQWTPDGGLIGLSLEQDVDDIIISVEDTGPGIPAEEHDKVIVPFWSQNRRGTGLGLAIAHELAEALGGHLTFYSEPGRGSRFTLVLPVVPAEAVPDQL